MTSTSTSIRFLEKRFHEVTGDDSSFWSVFVEPLSAGWILRTREKDTISLPIKTQFWVKRVKCHGDERAREMVGEAINVVFGQLNVEHADTIIELDLDQDQKKVVETWLLFKRTMYNGIVTWVNDKKIQPTEEILKAKLILENLEKDKLCFGIYTALRDSVVKEFLRDYQTTKQECEITKIPFSMKASKKKTGSKLLILNSMWNQCNGFFDTVLNPTKLSPSQSLPKVFPGNTFLICKSSKYYLQIPAFGQKQSLKLHAKENSYVVLNPGKDNFSTCIGSDCYITIFGGEGFTPDPSESMYNKVARYLCEHYDHIFVPMEEYQQQFLNILRDKAGQFKQLTTVTMVERCQLPFTCSSCGNIGKAIEEGQIFACHRCRLQCSSEENEAKNSLLRQINPYVSQVVKEVLDEYGN
ncbi:hypothetical protein FOA43_002108 [Brettanomyces nanus]|uniref:Uncharacterized protein n=1 Tax=Eeniella nana TaxID=13502 RepID=A0A875S6F7_EENNA|nr:uncharacterized protein FOA43_002108 [Brettanomyces nanus]QPG74774.1 hypothetical protein FOA43_002108 [Brettanomyces nanus]